MKKVLRSILFGSAIVTVVILAASLMFPHGDDGKVVTIESVVQERDQFEVKHPLESKPNTADNFKRRMAELLDRSRSYAAISEFNGESIVVQGYWTGPFEGISIRSTPTGQRDAYLLMKAGPNFLGTSSPIDRMIPRFLFHDPVLVEHGDFVKVYGVYHATGYGKPGGFLESANWLEFTRVERWDEGNRRWQRIDDF